MNGPPLYGSSIPNSRNSISLNSVISYYSLFHIQSWKRPHPVNVLTEPRTHKNNAAPLLPPVPVRTELGVENIPVPVESKALVVDGCFRLVAYQSFCWWSRRRPKDSPSDDSPPSGLACEVSHAASLVITRSPPLVRWTCSHCHLDEHDSIPLSLIPCHADTPSERPAPRWQSKQFATPTRYIGHDATYLLSVYSQVHLTVLWALSPGTATMQCRGSGLAYRWGI